MSGAVAVHSVARTVSQPLMLNRSATLKCHFDRVEVHFVRAVVQGMNSEEPVKFEILRRAATIVNSSRSCLAGRSSYR